MMGGGGGGVKTGWFPLINSDIPIEILCISMDIPQGKKKMMTTTTKKKKKNLYDFMNNYI